MKTDICIVGGGIIGLFSAYELCARGLQVCLIDRDDFGKQCTAAAGGILSPLLPWNYTQDLNNLCRQANQHYEKLSQQLIAETGINIEYQNSGLLVLADDNIDAHSAWCNDNRISCQPAIQRTEDIVSNLYKNALLLPEVSQLNPIPVVDGLRRLLLAAGAQLYSKTKVTGLIQQHGRVTGLSCSHGDIEAEAIVWATGAWAPELSSLINEVKVPPIQPIRGQAIAFDAADIDLNHIVIHQGHYLIPRQDGTILAGSTLEEVGYDNGITESVRADLLQRSFEIIPKLACNKVLRHWSGLRPASTTGQPIIGAAPQVSGLFLNCGHHRYGVTMAGSSAIKISDLVLRYVNANKPAETSLM